MMKKNEIFRKIGGILAELTEQYQYLTDHIGDLNDLELELFSANSNFLSEHIEILRKLNRVDSVKAAPVAPSEEMKNEAPQPLAEAPSNPEPATTEAEETTDEPSVIETQEIAPEPEETMPEETVSEEPIEAEPAPQKPVEEFFHPEITIESRQPEPSPVEPAAPVIKTPEPEIPVKPEPAEPVVHEVVIPEKIVENVVAENKPDNPAPTVNDLISAQQNRQKTVAAVKSTPVADLKSIISLNDKLLFIKDLFNGYSLAYSEAIEILNRFDSMEAADNFLKINYAGKNNWAAKQETTKKFYDLLERRFSQ